MKQPGFQFSDYAVDLLVCSEDQPWTNGGLAFASG